MNDRCLVRRGSLDANKKHLSITNQSTLKVGITVKDFELWYTQNSYNYTQCPALRGQFVEQLAKLKLH